MSRLKTTFRHVARLSLRGMKWLTVLLLFAWAVGAVYYFEFLPSPVAGVLALTYFTATATLLFRWQDHNRWLRATVTSIVFVYVFTLLHRPSNERDWANDNAQLADVQIRGDNVLIEGFRHAIYRTETDADVHYGSFDFKLSQLENVWFVVQRFTALEGIAHNFLTFQVGSEKGPQ